MANALGISVEMKDRDDSFSLEHFNMFQRHKWKDRKRIAQKDQAVFLRPNCLTSVLRDG